MLDDNAESVVVGVPTDGNVQQIDGYLQDNVTASQSAVELTRTGGRWKSPRAGSVVGLMLMLEASQVCTAGTLTVEVFTASVNQTTGVRTETATGLTAVLNTTTPGWVYSSQSAGLDTFVAASEVYAKVTTTSGWLPTTADLKAVILVEV